MKKNLIQIGVVVILTTIITQAYAQCWTSATEVCGTEQAPTLANNCVNIECDDTEDCSLMTYATSGMTECETYATAGSCTTYYGTTVELEDHTLVCNPYSGGGEDPESESCGATKAYFDGDTCGVG